MSLASLISQHPIPFDPDRGADALGTLPDIPAEARDLIAGTAGSSPYLARLIGSEAAWLAETLTGVPDAAMAALCSQAAEAEGAEVGRSLRGLKRRAALLIALADLGGVWTLEQVTGALTEFAEVALRAALRTQLRAELKRGKLPGLGEDDLDTFGGMVVLAMGKMGAGELNYSSDIDLICLFDETRYAPEDEAEARSSLVRATRRMAAVMSEVNADGYVFRTDLRLRPDASVTPVCISMAAAERYYEAEGRTWERAAYIKARAAVGDLDAGARFLETLQPFVWRRHLDFASIHETQDMRRRIRDHKKLHGRISAPGHDLKLGAGGIREIEFFAQTRQLVAGGRDPALRQRGTKAALDALAAADWIKPGTAETLKDHYTVLRNWEHRAQMVHDTQTHHVPQQGEAFDRFACLCGQGDSAAFARLIEDRLHAVDDLTEPFFAPGSPGDRAALPELSEAASEIIAKWPGYPALRSARGQEIFARLRPDLLSRLSQAAKPDEALASFDGFLRGLPAGVQIFSLFEANPALIDLIADICATAPGLARYLSHNAGVLDAVIGGDFFAPWPDTEELTRDLTRALDGADYERQLDAARVWQKEWHFRVGVHLLRGLISPADAAAQYAGLAEATVAALWPVVLDDVAARHGPAPGRGGAVVAMGSLGAGALQARSDLDLLVIYDAAGVDSSDGPRPLDPRAWYAKATKALVAGLSAPTAEGTLYEVDMRLRPSGRQGPVATGLQAFESYQHSEAWVWEHLALTRARPIAGPEALQLDIARIRQEVLGDSRDRDTVLGETAAMRARLRDAGRMGSRFDVKAGPGGAQDIELLAQSGALIGGCLDTALAGQLAASVASGVIDQDAATQLSQAHGLFSAVRQAIDLLTDRQLDLDEIGTGGRAVLVRAGGASDLEDLETVLDRSRADAAAIISKSLPEPPVRDDA